MVFWKNHVVFYVLGAFPPFSVIKGYVQSLWAKHSLNKIVMLKNIIVLVKFDSVMGMNEALQGGIYHFDNKL